MMVHWVALGIFGGILLAFASAKTKMRFRQKLLSEFEIHSQKGITKRYVTNVIAQRDTWVRSVSLIRKPFTKEINLAVETIALLIALLALVNAMVNFSKVFSSPVQAIVTLTVIGVVIAYIPCEWLVGSRVQADIDTVIDELRNAAEHNRLEVYMARAKEQWKVKIG